MMNLINLKNKAICMRQKIFIFFSFKKQTRWPKACGGPRQVTFPYCLISYLFSTIRERKEDKYDSLKLRGIKLHLSIIRRTPAMCIIKGFTTIK